MRCGVKGLSLVTMACAIMGTACPGPGKHDAGPDAEAGTDDPRSTPMKDPDAGPDAEAGTGEPPGTLRLRYSSLMTTGSPPVSNGSLRLAEQGFEFAERHCNKEGTLCEAG